MAEVKAYWWNEVASGGISNFGDGLAPYLLERFAGVKVVWATPSHANSVGIGSVLEHIPPLWDGHIVGTGKLFADSRLYLHANTATVWALRGPLSARGVQGSYALGDPGLLADELVEVPGRKWDLGVLPHWTDDKLALREEWRGDGWTTHYINPAAHPLAVVRQIAQCRKIVTSSLHGCIIADACAIPRRLEYAPGLDNPAEGGSFKFQDYHESIGMQLEFGRTVEANRFKVEDRKHEIFDAMEAYGRYMCSL